MTTIVHISDLHFDRIEPGGDDSLVEAIAEIDPTLIVASGDFTLAGREREFEAAARFLDRLSAPIIACPGNHDIPAYNLVRRFLSPLKRYNDFIASNTYAAVRLGDTAILALNSARPWDLSWNWSHGRLSRAQISEADAFFATHADATTKLLVTHHPFCVPSDAASFRRIGNADLALETLEAHGVNGVLTGHLHRQFRTTALIASVPSHTPVNVLSTGTALSDRRRDEPNGFLVLHCRTGIEAVEAYALSDGRFGRVPLRAMDPDELANTQRSAAVAAQPSQFQSRERNQHEPAALA